MDQRVGSRRFGQASRLSFDFADATLRMNGGEGQTARRSPGNVICSTRPRRGDIDAIPYRAVSAFRLRSRQLNRIHSTNRMRSNRRAVPASGRAARRVSIGPMLRRPDSALLCLYPAALNRLLWGAQHPSQKQHGSRSFIPNEKEKWSVGSECGN